MKLMRWIVLLALFSAPVALEAQEAGRDEARSERAGELRNEMRKLFKNRLRQALALTDDQMEAIGPRIERMEDERTQMRRKRTETVRTLRRGLESGATDDELQTNLERLQKLEQDQRESERIHMAAIDTTLTTRQRVQLRFFMEQFRSELTQKIRQLRGEGQRGRDRGFPQRRRPRRP